MPLTAQDRATDSYPVEAFGWDSAQSFFVEKSKLKRNAFEPGEVSDCSKSPNRSRLESGGRNNRDCFHGVVSAKPKS